MKQISNYVTGFIMKKDTALQSAASGATNKISLETINKNRIEAEILQNNHKLVCANILRVIAKNNLIRLIDKELIEHDGIRVNELNHDK